MRPADSQGHLWVPSLGTTDLQFSSGRSSSQSRDRNQWSQLLTAHSDEELRTLPNFQAENLPQEFRNAIPQELHRVYLDVLTALP